MRLLLSLTIAAAAIGACATVDRNAEPPFDEPEFTTGSNIPKWGRSREPVTVLSKEAFEGLRRWRPNPGTEGPAGRGH